MCECALNTEVLGLKKGRPTNCGPDPVRTLRSGGCRGARWLKKGDCPIIILYDKGAVRVFASNILHHITIVYI